jgi:hypothetical protein
MLQNKVYTTAPSRTFLAVNTEGHGWCHSVPNALQHIAGEVRQVDGSLLGHSAGMDLGPKG